MGITFDCFRYCVIAFLMQFNTQLTSIYHTYIYTHSINGEIDSIMKFYDFIGKECL